MDIKDFKTLSKEDLRGLTMKQIRDLNLLTRFYFDVIQAKNTKIQRPTPQQILRFINKEHLYEKTHRNIMSSHQHS